MSSLALPQARRAAPAAALRAIEVMKFGGAALATADAVRRVAWLVASRKEPTVVVVSAISGVTDALLEAASAAGRSDTAVVAALVDRLRATHLAVADAAVDAAARGTLRASVAESMREVEDLLVQGGSVGARALDALLAHGERLSVAIVAAALRDLAADAQVVDATDLLETDGVHGRATPDPARTRVRARAALLPLLRRGAIALVPGFIGRAGDGSVVTLGRGGSDLSATTLAAALGARAVTLWKDVPGLLTADPRVVPDARIIERLHASEAAELARFGAKVLHERALAPLGARQRVVIRSFADPDGRRTLVTWRRGQGISRVRAIAASVDRSLEDFDGRGLRARPGVATITAIGAGIATEPGVARRILAILDEASIPALGVAPGASGASVSVLVAATQADDAQRALHAGFDLHRAGGGHTRRTEHADVVLLGAGAIGRALLDQLTAVGTRSLRVCGVIDSSGFIFDPRGLSRRGLAAIRGWKAEGRRLAELPGGVSARAEDALEHIGRHALSRPILVDATAAETTPLVERAVTTGWDLVLANKVPLAAAQESVDRLLALTRTGCRQLRHEATVGAGLPVIDTLHKLIDSGDRVLRIEGCPSGTLGYLFGELGRGRRFSDALRDAIAAGYTEPDPRADLSGLDVARKALILARVIGFRGDLDDIAIESLVPEELRGIPLAEFVERLEELDAPWETRVRSARARGKVWRYRVSVSRRSVRVGLTAVDTMAPLGGLIGTDNQFSFTTTRYRHQPLVITGPGAGAAVTAAGVLNDLLAIAGQGSVRRGRRRSP